MTTALYTHPAALDHHTPEGHPERVGRMRAVAEALAPGRFQQLLRLEAPAASADDLLRCHPENHLATIRAAADRAVADGRAVALDADTWVSPGSLEAALRGAGGCVAAVDAVLAGTAGNAFVAMRPPGHHAERSRAMGFCLFGNAAIAALHALDHHGLSRVALVDFDVHHGNGTQDLLWNEERTLFASTHQMPLYPGTGAPQETGAHGQIVNAPLPPGADGAAFRRTMERIVLPRIEAHRPDLLIVSAGFDAHRDDPLASLELDETDFAWITERLCEIAERHCGGRLVSTLEGGYDLAALGRSVAAHVQVLTERSA